MGLFNKTVYSVSNTWISLTLTFQYSTIKGIRWNMYISKSKLTAFLYVLFKLVPFFVWVDISFRISEVSWKWRLKPHGTATNTHTQTMRTELIFFIWLFYLLSNVVSRKRRSSSTKTHTHTLKNLRLSFTTYIGVSSRYSAKTHHINGESIKNIRKTLPHSWKRWILID